VVLLTALGSGASTSIARELLGLGSGIIVVTPGHTETLGFTPPFAGNARPITAGDAAALARRVPGIDRLSGVVRGTALVEAKPRSRHVVVFGVTGEWQQVWKLDLVSGSFLSSGSHSVCLGKKLAHELFGDENPLGKFVTVGGTRLLVQGVVSKGRSLELDLDDMAYVPLEWGQKLFDLRGLTSIELIGQEGADVHELKEEVRATLKARHRDREDFTVVCQDDMLSVFTKILGAVTAGLGAITAVSLVVSGIGIANTLFVTVSERRGEVGLLLALGATPRWILVEFLLEAVAISLGGALVGLSVGAIAARPLGEVVLGESPTPSVAVLLVTLAVALGLGVLSGIWPAYRASLIPPAEVLRDQ
jgi:putative ABC transport system permease protein